MEITGVSKVSDEKDVSFLSFFNGPRDVQEGSSKSPKKERTPLYEVAATATAVQLGDTTVAKCVAKDVLHVQLPQCMMVCRNIAIAIAHSR